MIQKIYKYELKNYPYRVIRQPILRRLKMSRRRITNIFFSSKIWTKKLSRVYKNYTGTEDQIRALAATLEFTLEADYVTWSSSENQTNARLCYNFNWSGEPLIMTTDIIAVSWNDWTLNGKLSYVTYTHIYGSEPDISMPATYVPNNGPTANGGGFKFKMTQQNNYFWGKSGYGIFTLYHNYTRQDLSAYAEYGHSTITTSPTFSIPGYGSIGFSYGTQMAAQSWEDLNCQN